MFKSSVGTHEGTVLWLEDGANAFGRGDDVEPHEEVVVCQSNDMLCSGEGLPEAGVDHHCIAAWLEEHDERGRRGNPSGCRGETGSGRDCESDEQGEAHCEMSHVQERAARAGTEELPGRVRACPRMW